MTRSRLKPPPTRFRFALLLLGMLTPTAASQAGSQWTAPEIVPGSRDLVVTVPSLATDRIGTAWLMVDASAPFETPRNAYAAILENSGWSTLSPVDTTSTSRIEGLDVAFDAGNVRWTVWRNGDDGKIWYRRGEDSEAQILFDALGVECYAPSIAAGSTGPWCCWYGRSAKGYYQVYVSRWNGSIWGIHNILNIRLAGTDHLLCDVALDMSGNPHVVWFDSSERSIRYSVHSEAGWSFPVSTHDAREVVPVPSGGPRIRIDDYDQPHIVWCGTRRLPLDQYADPGIFHQALIDGDWSPPRQVNLDTSYHAVYPDLAIVDTQVWAVWHGEQGDWPVYTTTYVTPVIATPPPEIRLDDGRVNRNEMARILSTAEGPLVVWSGRGGTLARAILSRRGVVDPVPSFHSFRASSQLDRVVLTWNGDPAVFQRFEIDRRRGPSAWTRVGIVSPGPAPEQSWVDHQPPSARYEYRVRGILHSGEIRLLGPETVDATRLPVRFELQLYLNPARDTADLLVGSGDPGSLELRAYDVQGRVAGESYREEVDPGWYRLPLRTLLRPGTVRGIYFVRASLNGQRRHIKAYVP